MTTLRRLAVVSLITATAGIVVQILDGAKYPAVPPGALLLAAAAGLFVVRHKRTPLGGVAIGLFVTPNSGDHLSHPAAFGIPAPQLIGPACGVICGAAVAVQNPRKGQPA